MTQPILFIDLHGVLVITPQIFEGYKDLTIQHLVNDFHLELGPAQTRYDRAMKLWEKAAFDYLRDPSKRKTGQEFMDFLESCDRLFPTLLYEDLQIPEGNVNIRERPYEYKIAVKVKALYPEVDQVLSILKEQGYEMYVASSSHSSHIKGVLEGNEIDHYFEGMFGFDTVSATKHTLRYYHEMLNMVKANPKSSVMIGNSMHEILKPRKLGMKTIHINRERKVPNDVRRMADKSLIDITALPTHLDNLIIHA